MYSLEITHVDGTKQAEIHLSPYMAHVLANKLLKDKRVERIEVFNSKHELEETYWSIK